MIYLLAYQNPLYNDEYPEEWMKADFLNNKNLSDSVLMNRARETLCDYLASYDSNNYRLS